MDATLASVQVGTPVPARSAVPVGTARPAVPAGPAAGAPWEPEQPPAPHATAVTVEHDKRSGHDIVSVVDAITHEVLVQVPPAAVRAVIEGLLAMVHERQEIA